MSGSEQLLCDGDPAIPGLSVVLSDMALTEQFGDLLGADSKVTYLRYKFGTGIVAAIVPTAQCAPTFYLRAYAHDGRIKLRKDIDRAASRRSGTLTDAAHSTQPRVQADWKRNIVVGNAQSDRWLRPLRNLMVDQRVSTLRYKPGRRWVGKKTLNTGESFLIKVHARDRMPHTRLYQHLTDHGMELPAIDCSRQGRGVLRYEWIEGRSWLEVGASKTSPRNLASESPHRLPTGGEVGRLLAKLHSMPVLDPAPQQASLLAALDAELSSAIQALEGLAPALSEQCLETAGRAAAQIHEGFLRGDTTIETRIIHGDFSADQIMVRASDQGLMMVDLDRVMVHDPLMDLGSWASTQWLTSSDRDHRAISTRDTLGDILDGYEQQLGTVPEYRLESWGALMALCKATEPFRTRQPRWANHVERMVHLADELSRKGAA